MPNEDCKDMLQCFSDEKVSFLLAGAYAPAAHGYPRATMDIDIWVRPSPENADAVLRALRRFGAPLQVVDIECLEVRVPSIADLIRSKRASGRTKDLADAEALEALRRSETPGA